jgi:hypothetical protein
MRIRIALIAAATVACIMSFMAFTIFPAVAQAATGARSTGAHHRGGHRLDVLTRASRPLSAGSALIKSKATRRAGLPGAGFPTAALTAELAAHPAPVVAPAPPPPPPPPPTDATSTDTSDWQCIRIEESGDRYNSPTAPSGAYGILEVTWESNGYSGWPYEAPAATQDALALKLYNEFGWIPWSSRFACGL